MRTLLFMLVTLFTAALAPAQVAPVKQDVGRRYSGPVYGLGFSAGLASGIGLSFRHHLPSEVSYQLVGGIIKTDTKLYYDLGAELQYDIVYGRQSRFYTVGAIGYFYSGTSGTSGTNELRSPMRVGAGIGGEWSDGAPFHLAAEFLFTYFSDGVVLPLPQISGHYYFF